MEEDPNVLDLIERQTKALETIANFFDKRFYWYGLFLFAAIVAAGA